MLRIQVEECCCIEKSVQCIAYNYRHVIVIRALHCCFVCCTVHKEN